MPLDIVTNGAYTVLVAGATATENTDELTENLLAESSAPPSALSLGTYRRPPVLGLGLDSHAGDGVMPILTRYEADVIADAIATHYAGKTKPETTTVGRWTITFECVAMSKWEVSATYEGMDPEYFETFYAEDAAIKAYGDQVKFFTELVNDFPPLPLLNPPDAMSQEIREWAVAF